MSSQRQHYFDTFPVINIAANLMHLVLGSILLLSLTCQSSACEEIWSRPASDSLQDVQSRMPKIPRRILFRSIDQNLLTLNAMQSRPAKIFQLKPFSEMKKRQADAIIQFMRNYSASKKLGYNREPSRLCYHLLLTR